MKISLLAPVDLLTGYGAHAVQICQWFTKLGIEVVLRPTSFSEAHGALVPDDVKKLIQRGENDCEWEIILHPLGMAPTAGKRTIYFSMCESTRISPCNVELLNRAEIVVVPSQWCATVFSACGVTRPIVVIPLGVSEAWCYDPSFPDVFTFACAGRWASGPKRKGVQQVIECFQRAFLNREDVRLLVIGGGWNCGSDERIARLAIWEPESSIAQRISDVSCFVNLATGGFELWPLQAMATGVPVISFTYGGVAEYFNDRHGVSVAHHMVPAKDAWAGLGDWAEADDGAVIAAMRSIRDASKFTLQELSIEAFMATREFTWENHCKRLVDLVKEAAQSAPVVIESAPESEELTVCITNFKRADHLDRAIKSCVQAGIKNIVVASMEPDSEVADVVEHWIPWAGETTHDLTWTHLPVDLGCTELWLQAAYRSKTERLIILHDDDYLAPEFGKAYVEKISPAMNKGHIVTWLGRNVWETGVTAEARYFDDHVTGEYSIQEFHNILLDPIRLSLSPIVTVFRKTPLIQALKECQQSLTKPESFWHPEMQLGTEIVAHYRNSLRAKKWFYLDEVLSFYGTHEGSGTMLATKRGEIPYLKAGYNIARDYCRTAEPAVQTKPKIIFVFNDYHATGDSKRRNDYAMKTWEPHFNSGDMLRVAVWNESLPRTSESIGDPQPVPFLKDLIDRGMELAQRGDIIVYANRDICLVEGAAEKIIAGVQRGNGVALMTRRNIHRPIRNKIYRSVLHCPSDNGFDLIAFTPQWWKDHAAQMPDMLIGREVWDACFRRLAEESNGKSIFADGVTYHEFHESFWIKERVTNPGQLYNRRLGREFFASRVNAKDKLMANSAKHIMYLLNDENWK